MGQLAVLVGLGIVVFAATNVDDVFVLLAFFADPRFRARDVVLGQLAGMAALIAAGVALSLLALAIPPAYVGLLGLAPLGIGLWKLATLRRPVEDAAPASRGANVLAVAAVTIANGGDNLAVYTPFFATRRAWEVALLAALFLIMTGLWCALGYHLVRHPTLGKPIRRYGRHVLPWALLALGVFILVESGAARLLAPWR